jgi:hypothetical protein
MRSKQLGNYLGALSTLINILFWMLVWNPLKWNVSFSNDVAVVLVFSIAAMICAGFATTLASRWWIAAVAASLILFAVSEMALK